MHTRWYRIPVLALMLGSAAMVWAGGAAESPRIRDVTAITGVYGDGQKVSTVVLAFDTSVATGSLHTGDFAVEGKTVTRIYANTAPERNATGVDGNYVVLELDTAIAPDAGMPAGPGMNPSGTAPAAGAGSPPPGGGGPKLGEKSDKPATPVILTAKVTWKADIRTADGRLARASGETLASTRTVDTMTGGFRQAVYEDPAYPGQKLMYNLYVPEGYDAGKSYPLVLFMHDAGVVSNNPAETLTQGLGAVIWATPEEQSRHPAFVLAPQYDCVIADDSSGTAVQMDMTVHLVQQLMKDWSIDANRLYNTGQSMGGMTSIAMDIKYPGFFAASFLVACQWDAAQVAPMAGMPLWIMVSEGDAKALPGQEAIVANLEKLGSTVARDTWNAEADPAVLAEKVRQMEALGRTINFTVFQGGSHRYTWQHAYSIPGVRDWLFSQVKTSPLDAGALQAKAEALSRSGDPQGAGAYFRQAAALGDVKSAEMLGSLYAEGRGVSVDYTLALQYDLFAAARGSTRAATAAGILWLRGQGVAADAPKALEYFRAASDAGDFKAPRWAGLVYLKGAPGIPADPGQAAAWFTLAADRGDVTAHYWLGYLYEKGIHYAADPARAAELYRQAAPLTGHAEAAACTALGRLYETGTGVPRDIPAAREWYRRGAGLGDSEATAALARLGS